MKIPFHRRILPWLFALIFVFMAPAVVFYTAGYRWNAKKGAIERNGTLIIDTLPTGAAIQLNSKIINDKSPVTMQNVSPGDYNIELKLEGYHAWTKTLTIEPERVAFATDILLWPIADPQKISDEQICFTSAKPEGTALLIGICKDGNIASFAVVDPETNKLSNNLSTNLPLSPVDVNWNASDDRILIQASSSGTLQTLLYQSSPAALSALPDSTYHWDGSNIWGASANQTFFIKSDGSVERASKDENIIDSLGVYSIQRIPNSPDLALVVNSRQNEGHQLPQGNWRIREQGKGYVLLRDGTKWLWLDTSQRPFKPQYAVGQWPSSITVERKLRLLLTNNNEVWTWTQGQEPDLIYRQSDPIKAAAWHANGHDVFIATDKEIFALNLDTRGGRLRTVLATFDEIKNATVIGDAAYIAGTKDGSAGLWRLQLTKTTSALPSFKGF